MKKLIAGTVLGLLFAASIAFGQGSGFFVVANALSELVQYGLQATARTNLGISFTFTGDGTILSSTPSSASTGTGTLTASLNTQSANCVLAGPTTGSPATPTCRSLVSADLPSGGTAHTISIVIASNGVGFSNSSTDTSENFPVTFSGSIAASTTPVLSCRTLPAATVTFVVKLWSAAQPSTSSTLCSGTISTAGVVSCSISSTSLSSGQAISAYGYESSADAAAQCSIGIPVKS